MAYGTGQILPLGQTPEEAKKRYEFWQSEIARAEKLRDDKLTEWDAKGNIDRYEGKHKGDEVNDGSDFADAERKRAGLFFDTPFITVKPDPEGHPSVAALHQELLNSVLDEPMVNAKAVALKAIQSCLVAIQPAWTKIGYVPTVVSVPSVDPMSGLPIEVPQVVHEDFFWVKLSSRSGLLPVDCRDTDYDRAASWLGYKFRMPTSQLRRTYNIPDDVVIPSADGAKDLYFTDDEIKPVEDADDPLCSGTYIEYKAAMVDPSVSHPLLIRCLVLVDGMETPIKHEDAPWLIDPATKQFNPNSGFKGFSIHPLTLRYLEDSAYVPADSTITAALTGEITDFLEDAKRQRQSNRLANLYDPAKLPVEVVERLEQGKAPANIPVKPGSLDGGKDTVMVPITQLSSGREHYLGLEIFQGKRERVLGISANTVGAQEEGSKTATEIGEVTRNTEARFEQERQQAVDSWYLSGVRKLSAMLVRYGDRLAMDVLGQQRGQAWVQARDQGLLHRFTFTVQVDSGRYMDSAAELKRELDILNITAKDQHWNRIPSLKRIASLSGKDPAEVVVETLPKQEPEPPKINFALAAADLNPTLPQFPFVVKVLRQGGVDIGVDDVMLAQMQAQALGLAGRSPVTAEQEQTQQPDPNDPMGGTMQVPSGPSQVPTAGVGADPNVPPPEHGGAPEPADRINQHQMDLTGNRPGPAV
jgi:hypothetical protein